MVRKSSRAARLKDKLRKQTERLQTKFMFFPVKRHWKIQQRSSMNIISPLPDIPEQDQLAVPLTTPTICHEISPDGNCLFRSISYAVTGSEDHHFEMRRKICNYMRTHAANFVQYLPQSANSSVNTYLNNSAMEQDRTWGTDVEIHTAADMLQTNIYVYSQAGGVMRFRWLRHQPATARPDHGIYLYHKDGNHFNVVIQTQNSNRISQIGLKNIRGNYRRRRTEECKFLMSKRYKTDNSFRELKLECQRQQYASDTVSSNKKKQAQRLAYSDPIVSDRKKRTQRQAYSDPIVSDRKKRTQRQAYSDPIVSDRKKRTQRQAYSDPIVSDRKKRTQRQAYFNPIVSDRKKRTQRQAYCDPIVSDRKKRTQRQAYSDPIVSDRKKRTQRQAYSDPIVSDRKKRTQRQAYSDPIVSDRKKRTQRQAYSDPIVSDRKKRTQRQTYCDPIVSDRKKRTQRQTYSDPIVSDKKKQIQRDLYASNPIYASKKNEYGKWRYKTISLYRKNLKMASILRYVSNAQFRKQLKSMSKQKYADNLAFRQKVKQQSKQKYADNPTFRQNKKQQSKQKYAKNVEFRQKTKEYSKWKYQRFFTFRHNVKLASVKKYAKNRLFRASLKMYLKMKYYETPDIKQRKKERVKTTRKSITMSIQKFKADVQRTPKYVCTVCVRLLYKSQGIECKQRRYFCDGKLNDAAAKCLNNFSSHKCEKNGCAQNCWMLKASKEKEWICHTCDRYLKTGSMPPQASANQLQIPLVPAVLSELNVLERQLIAMRIPFMKLLSLPKGGQKGVKGPVVNVPSDVSSVTSALPRNVTDAQLLKVKLKRKISYKGYYSYKWINPMKVLEALKYLKEHNSWYENVIIDPEWLDNIRKDDLVQPENQEKDSDNETIELSDTDVHDESGTQNRNDETDSDSDTIDLSDSDLYDRTIETTTDDSEMIHTSHTDAYQRSTQTRFDGTKSEHVTEQVHKRSNSLNNESTDESNFELPVETCLQPVDIGQDILDSNSTLCIAPAEKNKPQNIFQEKGSDVMAFPTLFPEGHFGLFEDRKVKLSPGKYFNARLFSADRRFATNKEYIFFAQYVTELNYISCNISLAIRKGKTTTEDGKPVTAGMILDSNNISEILRSDLGFRFLQPVRGTPPYWQRTMKDLYSMIHQLGIPTWFVTFSAAEMRWDEVIETLLYSNNDSREAKDVEWSERCQLITDNPVMTARMFDHRVKALFTNLLMSPSAPVGRVVDFFYRTEFQQRGSPHIHALLWIDGAPKFNENTDEEVCRFIDSHVACKMPDSVEDPELYDIISTVQVHSKSHTKSCKKYGTTCRFNFPKPPIRKTFIARKDSEEANKKQPTTAKELDELSKAASVDPKLKLRQVWVLLSTAEESGLSFPQILQTANITYRQYKECLIQAAKSNTVHIKRGLNDMWVNNYNPHLSRAWNGNLDIQFVVDAYACVAYILSYISKAETEMGDLLLNAQKEAEEGNKDAMSSLRKIGNTYLQNREVSAQEAVYRVCGLHLKDCSREVVFVPAGTNIMKMSLPVSVIKSRFRQGGGNEENIWMTSLHDKYYARPDTPNFENICMAEFVSKYNFISRSQKPKSTLAQPVYKLRNDIGIIKRRKTGKEAVVRFPRFNVTKNPEEYHLTLLQLYLPHRSPITLPDDIPSFQAYVNTCSQEGKPILAIIEENRHHFELNSETLNKAWEDVQEGNINDDAWANLAPEAEVERLESIMEKDNDINMDEQDEIPELQSYGKTIKNSTSFHYEAPKISQKQLQSDLKSMNDTQQRVFYQIRDWCFKVVWNVNPEPFFLFLTGGAGTGKSHLIKCIYHEMTRILSKTATSPDSTVVLLTAPTGTAAFNIQGMTIHSSFAINKKVTLPYQPLGENLLNTLRSKFDALKILIIDEISMVVQKILAYIHGRLAQIKHTKRPFGDVSIMAVGDFYQLPPVRGLPLYKRRESNFTDLWNDRFSIVTLTEVMRQKDDSRFANMLNRLRIHERGQSLLPHDHQSLLEASVLETPEDATCALHIFPTNNEVNAHNNSMIEKVCSSIIVSVATDFQTDIVTGRMTRKEHPYSTCTPEDLQTEVKIGKNARVMLTRNVDTDDGLVNGAFGTVTEINVDHSGNVNAIYIKFDNSKVGKSQMKKQIVHNKALKGSVRIQRFVDCLIGKKVTRKQLPIKLAWAATIHKVQGMTVNQIVVSLKKIFQPGMAYVALSRAKSLSGLHILDYDPGTIYSSDNIKDSLQAMSQFLPPQQSVDINDFTIIHHNTEGLLPHLSDIQTIHDFNTADVICLTETWLSDQHTIPTSLFPNHVVHHVTRSAAYDNTQPELSAISKMERGGVAVFVNKSCLHRRSTLHIPNIEAVAVLINCVLVVAVYRPPMYPLRIFIENIKKLLNEVHNLSIPCLFVGDFNSNLLQSENDLVKTLQNYGYRQLVNFPTTEGGTCLDLVFEKGFTGSCSVQRVPTFYSYHDAVKITLKCCDF